MMGKLVSALQASVVVVACICAAGEGACPIDSNGNPSCQPVNADGSRDSAGAEAVQANGFPGRPARHLAADADLISQEVKELEAMIALSEEKIQLLETLQDLVQSGKDLPAAQSRAVRQILEEKVPMVSEAVADPEVLPSGPAEDYAISKSIVHQKKATDFIAFLPLRAAGAKDKSESKFQKALAAFIEIEKVLPPSALLVSVAKDGRAWIYAPSGELLLEFHTGHNDHAVTHLTASSLQDQYLIATSDAGGLVRLHNVKVQDQRPITAAEHRELMRQKDREERERRKAGKRPRKPPKHDPLAERNATYLGSTTFGSKLVNVTVQFQRQVEVSPGAEHGESGDHRVTSVAMLVRQGSKYLVVGDAQGKISVFGKNGTFHGKIDATMMPGAMVEGLYVHQSHVLFRAGVEWGYVDFEKLQVSHVECPEFEGKAIAAIIDSSALSRVIVADDSGDVWVFNIRQRKYCTVQRRFPRAATKALIDIASVQGYILGLERKQTDRELVNVLALNMSSPDGEVFGPTAASALAWRRTSRPVRDWAVIRRSFEPDLLAFLSEDGFGIEVVELLMGAPQVIKESSPTRAIIPSLAVLLVLGMAFILLRPLAKKKIVPKEGEGKDKEQGKDAGKSSKDNTSEEQKTASSANMDEYD